ncbi:AraC family transcriptional regulator [Comamonas composti]|uniref:AraC family transcriptional regulator n=1 Tax=Comamonas composti TaxID=408558 RepID=UPI000403BBE6|nr:helix-turn-helix transcriptional regulator [Comamonas composti]
MVDLYARDYSESLDGPALIAVRGSEALEGDSLMGLREYGWHSHARGQVFCVEQGLIHVDTPHGAWLLPPQRAGWMPPGMPHKIRISGQLGGWMLLVTPGYCAGLPPQPCVIGTSAVLHALALRAVEWDKQAALAPEQLRMAAVIHDEIRRAPHEDLHLPMPRDARLLRIAHALLQDPGNVRTLEDWAAYGALSPRTLRRLMRAETGMGFAQWRQQAQIAHGLDLLAQGLPVARVSDALGYASPSNFIAMFRKALGDSPAQYFARRRAI